MATSALLKVTPEAAARSAQMGLKSEIDRMIDYARQNLSELTHIEVNLYDRYEMGEEPGLAIEAYSSRPFDLTDHAEEALDRWMISEFPAEVLEHVLMTYRLGVLNAG